MPRENYPKRCAFPLDERDGHLFCRGELIRPVPRIEDSPIYPSSSSYRDGAGKPVWLYLGRNGGMSIPLGHERETFSRLLGSEWHLLSLYQCANCRRWTVGSTSHCSPDCEDATKQAKRQERVEARASARSGRHCPICNTPLDPQRATRAYCSNRCRQLAYRQRAAAEGAA
jgi:hypothetical protein